MKYKITKKNIFIALNEVIIYGIIVISLAVYLWFNFIDFFLIISGLLFLFYLLIIFFPTMILFLNYYKCNKNVKIVLEKNKIIINNDVIYTSDIVQIDIYGNKMFLNGQVGVLPHHDNFYYLVLILKNNSRFILTSILGNNIEKKIKAKYPNLIYTKNVKSYPLVAD